MKNLIHLIIFISLLTNAQTGLINVGGIKIHDTGQMGFHLNLVNNGVFNTNLGLTGFYNTDEPLTISGSQIPKFYSMEVDVSKNLHLETTTEVENDLSYINGHIITPRDLPAVSLHFLNDAVYVLEDDLKHTDGYASFSGDLNFTFPIGDDNKLRPLMTPFQNGDNTFFAAYFNENPNTPSTFSQNFNTDSTEDDLNTINTNEFWDFNGTAETTVTLTWDQDSQISNLVDDLQNLKVVGWNIATQKWSNLGNTETTGNLNEGTITSESFIPNTFEIITFGTLTKSNDVVIYNAVTPNGDGDNDYFIIDGIEGFENTLHIYNRWGRLVYETENYKNNWDGISNQKVIKFNEEKLPVGTYFYVLTIPELNKEQAGYLYLHR